MNIDIGQFQQTFLEEAGEHLADLETGLLAMEQGDNADMNAIFRAAHSIKGGAATFGFNAIADFTHVVESVLELARDEVIPVTSELTTELLKSLDIITELLDAAKNGEEVTPADHDRCLEALKQYLNTEGTPGDAPAAAAATAEPAAFDAEKELCIYSISFKPKPFLAQTGSDPVNILRELIHMGDAQVTCHTEPLPTLTDITPEDLYLWWEIELETTATDTDIRDVFLFVEDEADIDVQLVAALGPVPQAAQTSKDPAEVVTATPMQERRADERRQSTDRRSTAREKPAAKENQFIRVAIDKVDSLLNLVGELVTTNAMVVQHTGEMDLEDNQLLSSAISSMSGHTRNLQEAIMAIRMMPVDFAFSRFPRMVRDTAQKLGKQVRLETSGSQTELDKTVIEKISDPLTHLVRNSVDHGIEMPDERAAANKPAEGVVLLSAFYRGGSVIIEIRDDGKGLDRNKIVGKALEKGLITQDQAENMPDEEVWNLIFNSGFSTAAEVTDVSGRGIGMDVVRKNIQSLGGSVSIRSETGVGSCFSISLPLTLAILDGMAIRVGEETFIVPLLNILESLRPTPDLIKPVQNGVDVIDFRGEYLPLLRLHKVLHVPTSQPTPRLEDGIAVVVETEQGRIALFVDELLGERQVVIKSIEQNYKTVEGISGATIMGDGRVAFILDLQGLVKLAEREGRYRRMQNGRGAVALDLTPTSMAAEDIGDAGGLFLDTEEPSAPPVEAEPAHEQKESQQQEQPHE